MVKRYGIPMRKCQFTQRRHITSIAASALGAFGGTRLTGGGERGTSFDVPRLNTFVSLIVDAVS